MPEHYFATQPSSEPRERLIRVVLAGEEHAVRTASGTFSPDRLDQGTAVLLHAVPDPPVEGTLLDVGCGWGPIALSMGLLSPNATVYAVDVNERSLDLARRNAATVGATNVIVCSPEAVPADVRFDCIWSNPPIHVGKEVLHEILLMWIPRLNAGGSAFLVVQKHLGSDSLAHWLAETLGGDFAVKRVASKNAFRVLRVTRA